MSDRPRTFSRKSLKQNGLKIKLRISPRNQNKKSKIKEKQRKLRAKSLEVNFQIISITENMNRIKRRDEIFKNEMYWIKTCQGP